MEEKNQENAGQPVLEPRQGFTIFDFSHLSGTLSGSTWIAMVIAKNFGWWWALVGFVITIVAMFFVLAYAIAAFVLFLHRRCSPQSRIGYEVACYVLSHFNKAGR